MEPETPSNSASSACESCKSTRRQFLLKLGVGLNVAAGAMIGIPIAGYVASILIEKYPLQWINLGPLAKFPQGKTMIANYLNPYRRSWDGDTALIPCWVRRLVDDPKEGVKFQIFAINCAHLGCPVRWFEESQLFLCPCHGGAYYADGSRASGPPERGLFEYEYEVRPDPKTQEMCLYVKGGILPTLAEGHA